MLKKEDWMNIQAQIEKGVYQKDIAEEKVRLCVVADGADWIWNRVEELFPDARQVMDFYHCSEYLHKVAAAQYGKGSEKGMEWVHATLVRLSLSEQTRVIAGLKIFSASSFLAGHGRGTRVC